MSLSRSTWVVNSRSTKDNPVYERLLGQTELGFYWDTVCSGTADTLQHLRLECTEKDLKILLDPARILSVWTYLKQRFPLLASRLEPRDNGVYFTVASHDLQRTRPGEFTWKKIDNAGQAEHLADRLIRKEQHLSDDLLASIFVLERTDANSAFNVIFHISHCITDGMANGSLVRSFLDLMCTLPPPGEPFQLQKQLSLSVASESVFPTLRYNIARRRWRIAIARTILQIRAAKFPKIGGHTIPRKMTTLTGLTFADSRNLVYRFPESITEKIMQTCRKHQITFGNAFPVIGQMAITRVLLRKYLRGEIDKKEWEFRQREYMISGGPINLRPFLDTEWLKQGGIDNLSLAIGFYIYRLPFMPLGRARNIVPGMALPTFDDLLSKPRFFQRCTNVRHQSNALIRHPLFIELGAEGNPRAVERMRAQGEAWRKYRAKELTLDEVEFNAQQQASASIVFGTGGSSMGNVDLLVPKGYPLDPSSQANSDIPKLYLKENTTLLRCRPGELYLGAATSENSLRVNCFWDGNVYEEDLIRQFLEEVQGAIRFYLGDMMEDIPDVKAHL